MKTVNFKIFEFEFLLMKFEFSRTVKFGFLRTVKFEFLKTVGI